MRIDPFNSTASQVSNEPASQQVAAQNAALSSSEGAGDRTTLTSDSASLSSLVGKALSSPEVRQDRVDSLKQSVSSGNYNLDPGKIASSMIDDYA